MHEYFQLKAEVTKVLEAAGFVKEREDVHPDVFGSAYLVFVRGEEIVRLVWDGRDGVGFVECLDGERWVDIGTHVPESAEDEFKERSQELANALNIKYSQSPTDS